MRVAVVNSSNEPEVSDVELVDRWDRGERMAEIARAVGLTRQRVYQRLLRHGRGGPNRIPTLARSAILSAARGTTSTDHLAAELSLPVSRLVAQIEQHGIADEVAALLTAARSARSNARRLTAQGDYVHRLRSLAQEVGHTPTMDELQSVGMYHPSLKQLFGSVDIAMREAGLEPNEPGRPPKALPRDFADDDLPTANPEVLVGRARRIQLTGISEVPRGQPAPQRVSITSSAFYRDPRVVAWVLSAADGYCEACGQPGYEVDDGARFLEVHHVVDLARGGPDTVANAVAVCETCHGKLHRWVNREQLREDLYAKVRRLRRVPSSS